MHIPFIVREISTYEFDSIFLNHPIQQYVATVLSPGPQTLLIYSRLKVKLTLEQATEGQGWSRGMALLFL